MNVSRMFSCGETPLLTTAGADARNSVDAAAQAAGPAGSQAGVLAPQGSDRGRRGEGGAIAQTVLERQQQPGTQGRDTAAAAFGAAGAAASASAGPEEQSRAGSASVTGASGVSSAGGTPSTSRAFSEPDPLLRASRHAAQVQPEPLLDFAYLASLPPSGPPSATATATATLNQGGATTPTVYRVPAVKGPTQKLAVASMQRVHAAAVSSAAVRGVLSAFLGAFCALAWASGASLQCPGESPVLQAWRDSSVPLPPWAQGGGLSLPHLPVGGGPLLLLLLSDGLLLLSCAMLGLGTSGTAKGTPKGSGETSQGLSCQGFSQEGFSGPEDLLGAQGGSSSSLMGGLEGAGGESVPGDGLVHAIQRAQYAFSRGSMALFTLSSVVRDLCLFLVSMAAGVILLCPEVALPR